ncbi:MAG: phosphatase PAP2 family protein [Burkholderiaceae bacterium]|nr:phosphatase PAP2 family protein [Burkholderiaceae bacterium]MEB2349996.1 phosphatase PAP2 family protein [Burkholderiaceae bacterium]
MLAVSVAILALMALDLVFGGPVSSFDRAASAWLRGFAGPATMRAMTWVSALHAPRPIVAATLGLAALLLIRRRDRRGAVFVLLSVIAGAILNALLKRAFERPRPDFEGPGHAGGDFAFPSGHVANSALFYGSLALLLLQHLDGRAARRGVVAAAVALVVLVGASRIVLGAHYPGDVVAAMAEALAWLALCAMATGMARRGRKVRRRAGDCR